MTKAIILTEEEVNVIRKALYLYLSASDKKDRQQASELAKEAFKIIADKEYDNPKNNSFKTLMLDIL
jgi:phosphoglycerate-specific signal transduction histidine kinase